MTNPGEYVNEVNYFTKRFFTKITLDIIIEHKLLWDEPYYLLKEHYKSRFHFSSGNEMFFTTNKSYAELKMRERIAFFVETPQVLSIDEMEMQLGLNKFSLVNSPLVKKCGKKFFIYNDQNERHRNYLKTALMPFIKSRMGTFFKTRDLRYFCSLSNDLHIRRFSEYKPITKVVIDLFDFIAYDRYKSYEFTFKNSIDNP